MRCSRATLMQPLQSKSVGLIIWGLLAVSYLTLSLMSRTTNDGDSEKPPNTKGETEVLEELVAQLPSVPLTQYLSEQSDMEGAVFFKHQRGSSCAKMPEVWDLHFNNLYWQETKTSNGTFYMYGAYLDRRKNLRSGPEIRVLGMIDRLKPIVQTHCQIWFQDDPDPVIVPVQSYKYMWRRQWGNARHGTLQPYLFSCQLPQSHWNAVPNSVSVVEKECNMATNNLLVTYNPLRDGEKKKKFAVCVKALDFLDVDLSVRLVEWMEMLNILGADKVFIYNYGLHPNMIRTVEDYAQRDMAVLTNYSLPGNHPNFPMLQHLWLNARRKHKDQIDLIPYNDCFYRNIYRYEYVGLLDIDEVIMPVKKNSWAKMLEDAVADMHRTDNKSISSFVFRNVFFLDDMLPAEEAAEGYFKDIPRYHHMLQHVYRSTNETKMIKGLHNTEEVLTLHNHFPLSCIRGCRAHRVNNTKAQMQHYRGDCYPSAKRSGKCAEIKADTVRDDNIWRFQDELVSRTAQVLRRLGILPRR